MSTSTTSALILPATLAQATEYFNLFINRQIHVQQSTNPNKKGRHYFYKACDRTTKLPIGLTPKIVQAHLSGRRTIGFYASSPKTQSSKWIAIDADYPEARRDLLLLQEAFQADDVVSLMESSRRGGHLWIFFAVPLPAELCRLYVLHIARHLGVAIKQGEEVPGLELFPRQNSLEPDEFGSAIRGPLGVHRTSMQRYWFEGAEGNLGAQLELLRETPKVTLEQLAALTRGLAPIKDPVTLAKPGPLAGLAVGSIRGFNPDRFDILRALKTPVRRQGRNYVAECPSCHEKPLAISVANPDLYRCWHGCTKEMIREALGCPITYRSRLAA
jgi:hypothetical protein